MRMPIKIWNEIQNSVYKYYNNDEFKHLNNIVKISKNTFVFMLLRRSLKLKCNHNLVDGEEYIYCKDCANMFVDKRLLQTFIDLVDLEDYILKYQNKIYISIDLIIDKLIEG